MTHNKIESGEADYCLDCCPENTNNMSSMTISRRRVVRSGFLGGAAALVSSSRTPRSVSANHFGCRYPDGTGAPYYLDFSKLYSSRLTDGSILDPITIIQRAYCGYKNGLFPGGKIDLGTPYADPRSGRLHLWDGYWNQNFSGPLGYTNLMIQPLNGRAYRLYGDWLAKFMERGGPRVFGAPIDDPHAAGPGVEQYFQGGRVRQTGFFRQREGAPVYVVQGAILERYRQETGTSGRLGAPKSNEYAWGSGARSDFANGSIVYHSGGRIEVLVGASPPSALYPLQTPTSKPVSEQAHVNAAVQLLRDTGLQYIVNAIDARGVKVDFQKISIAGHLDRFGKMVINELFLSWPDQDLAALMAHEGQHAADQVRYGLIGYDLTESRCYSVELRAHLTAALTWQTWYGPEGKPNPTNLYEKYLNRQLWLLREHPDLFVDDMYSQYIDECHVGRLRGWPEDSFLTMDGLPPGIDTQIPTVTQTFERMRHRLKEG